MKIARLILFITVIIMAVIIRKRQISLMSPKERFLYELDRAGILDVCDTLKVIIV